MKQVRIPIKIACYLLLLSRTLVIFDYFKNGYYTEKEVFYGSAKKGKIHWKRTIQQKTSFLSNNNPIYLDFIIKKNGINTNNILTKIHEYCVYESFLKIGWLYTDELPIPPQIKFMKKMFIHVINEALLQTFNENKKQLFNAMLNILNNINELNPQTKEYLYGTYSFEYTWERMIEYVFGESNKEIYFPKARWALVDLGKYIESSSLQPDTIMKINNKIYILDAKYYKYGITGNPSHLPSSSSIQKQITYGEYLLSDKFSETYKQNLTEEDIFNVFLMPFNQDKKQDEPYKFIGIATADWKNNKKIYEKVFGILLDTKYLMDNCCRQDVIEMEKLSTIIEQVATVKIASS